LTRLFPFYSDKDYRLCDGVVSSPSEIHNYLGGVMHGRRNKMNPLWNTLVVGGYKDNAPFLGVVDLIGSMYVEPFVATGYGGHLAIPLLRKHWHENMSRAEAVALLEDCMRVLYYRDCRAINKFYLCDITSTGVHMSEPYSLTTKWDYTGFVRGQTLSVAP